MGSRAGRPHGRDHRVDAARRPHRDSTRVPRRDTPDPQDIIRRACKTAGIAQNSPHDLRHRYASVQIARGVPVTTLASQLGHTRKSLTLDVYSHVLIDEGHGA